MQIKILEVGMLAANCFIVACPETKEAAVIDPGDEASRIANTAQSMGVTIKKIINTHGHGDHIGGNTELKKLTNAEIICHQIEEEMLTSSAKNLSLMFGFPIDSPNPEKLVQENDIIQIGSTIKLKVLHTPGHTKGGICLVGEGVVFTGDTLFAGSVGRTDFPGGSYSQLMESIKNKLLNLPEETIVYAGHGPSSTIGREKRSNPFIIG